MSDYSKSTNFTSKDTLPTGNAGKIVKGTELDTEFTAISSAIASKADISSPALLGTPTSPTATVGTNTTQIASTAFVKTAVDALGTIGTMAAQNKTAVDITGGTVVGITDLTVADGGTGSSTLTANSVILGNGTSALSGNLVAPGTIGNVLKSNGTTWTSAAPAVVKGLGLGGEVYNDVTGSRAFGTTYTNSYSYPIQVSAYTNLTNGTPYCQAFVNGSRVAWWQWQFNGTGAIGGVIFIVPPGATYKIDGNGSLQTWFELY
jgi:hypothetical protein